MKHILLALVAAAGISAAAPASAFSFPMELPRLTFPTPPAPDASQGCINLNTLSGETCTTSTK